MQQNENIILTNNVNFETLRATHTPEPEPEQTAQPEPQPQAQPINNNADAIIGALKPAPKFEEAASGEALGLPIDTETTDIKQAKAQQEAAKRVIPLHEYTAEAGAYTTAIEYLLGEIGHNIGGDSRQSYGFTDSLQKKAFTARLGEMLHYLQAPTLNKVVLFLFIAAPFGVGVISKILRDRKAKAAAAALQQQRAAAATMQQQAAEQARPKKETPIFDLQSKQIENIKTEFIAQIQTSAQAREIPELLEKRGRYAIAPASETPTTAKYYKFNLARARIKKGQHEDSDQVSPYFLAIFRACEQAGIGEEESAKVMRAISETLIAKFSITDAEANRFISTNRKK